MILLTNANALRFLAGALYLLLVVNCIRFRMKKNLNVKPVDRPLPHLDLSMERKLQTVNNFTSMTEIGNFHSIHLHFKNYTNISQNALQAVTDQQNSMLRITCAEPDLTDGGPITPNTTLETLDKIEAWFGPLMHAGGTYEPKTCIAKYYVAILVPFRDRYAHLCIFLRNIHPFLMKQRIAYRIFVIEQADQQPFNRAALLNVGYLEALKHFQWDCFIFHDVDLLPLDDRNLYNCPRQPRHMSVAIDNMNFKLPYRSLFGGVSAMTRQHFQTVNGFSNSFVGWGGEDDDMANRLTKANLFISRYPINIARYMMLKHRKQKANPKRFEYLKNGKNKAHVDGINSIKYEICGIELLPTFTWYLVKFEQNS